jgi:hypothetical protein
VHRFFYALAWVWMWMVIVGGLLITHVSIFYIVCGATNNASGCIEKPTVFLIGIVSIVFSITGLAKLKKRWADES